jgi:hypothetical protein
MLIMGNYESKIQKKGSIKQQAVKKPMTLSQGAHRIRPFDPDDDEVEVGTIEQSKGRLHQSRFHIDARREQVGTAPITPLLNKVADIKDILTRKSKDLTSS